MRREGKMRKGQVKLIEKIKRKYQNKFIITYFENATEPLSVLSKIEHFLNIILPTEISKCEDTVFDKLIENIKSQDMKIYYLLNYHVYYLHKDKSMNYLSIEEYFHLMNILSGLSYEDKISYLKIYTKVEGIEELIFILGACEDKKAIKKYAEFFYEILTDIIQENLANIISYANYYISLNDTFNNPSKNDIILCSNNNISFEEAKKYDFNITNLVRPHASLFLKNCSEDCFNAWKKQEFTLPEEKKQALENLDIKEMIAIEFPVYYKRIRINNNTTITIKFEKYAETQIEWNEEDEKYSYYMANRVSNNELLYFLNTNRLYYKYNCKYNKDNKKLIPLTIRNLCYLKNTFKETFIELISPWLEKQAKTSKVYLDIIRLINSTDIIPEKAIPPIPLVECDGKNTLQELIEAHYKNGSILNWNKTGLQLGYAYYKLRNIVDSNSQGILWQGLQKYYMLWDGMNDNFVLATILKDRLSNYSGKDESIITDYFKICKKTHRKAKLTFRSMKKLEEAHNEVAIIQRNKYTPKIIIPRNTKFRELQKILPQDEFEWIKSKKRIVREGVEMHHCVTSYADLVNRDHCAIYSFIRKSNNNRYTIEFAKNEENKYYIKQMQSRYNRWYVQEDYDYVKNIIQKAI